MAVRCVVDAGNLLGEGPVWEARTGTLWWLDIEGLLVQSYQPEDGAVSSWDLPEPAGALAIQAAGGLLLALASGLAAFDPETAIVEQLCDPESDRAGNRFNDGGCDPAGRFWVGSMDRAGVARTGSLYRYESGGACERVLDGMGIPNTVAWSPDGRTFYLAETLDRTIYAYDFSTESGTLGGRRVFAVTEGSYPDGSAVDSRGFLWNAQWDGYRVVRYAPDGSIDRVVEMPVQRPTSCAFGGPDLDVLYVTSARTGLTAAELEAQPAAGGLFAFEPGVRGLPTAPFGG